MSNIVAKNFSNHENAPRADVASLYAADGHRKYLNREERLRAIETMHGLDADKALFALTLAWTGARVSEVLALTPASFQIERGVVAFITLKRRSHSVREVPLPTDLLSALDRHFELRRMQGDPLACSERLWHWRRETAWRLIKQVMAKSGLTGRSASPRGLRHGFGVGAIQAGIPLNLVQRWLGHAHISTTAIYTDASGPEERDLAQKFWRMS